MEFLENYKDYKSEEECVVILGKFDGVHMGHRRLIEVAKEEFPGTKIVAFTFSISEQVKTLVDSKSRRELLFECGVSVVIEQLFDEMFASTSPEDFLRNVLINSLKVKGIVCGEDFCFGKNRSGNIAFLKINADTYGYKLLVVDKVCVNTQIVSSTTIRNELLQGNVETVNEMLGYRYFIEGTVVSGNRLGRKFNFPTANICINSRCIVPLKGVYATIVHMNNEIFYGVTNVGVKPTVGDYENANVETHLLNFTGDIYGCHIRVEFCKFFRMEKKFESLDELYEQITNDTKNVKDYFQI